MKRLRFDAPPHHVLHPKGPESEAVGGGEEFDCDDKQAEELLTNPRLSISEVKPKAKPKRKSSGGRKRKKKAGGDDAKKDEAKSATGANKQPEANGNSGEGQEEKKED